MKCFLVSIVMVQRLIKDMCVEMTATIILSKCIGTYLYKLYITYMCIDLLVN